MSADVHALERDGGAGMPELPNSLPRPEDELQTLKALWQTPKGWRILSSVNNTIVGYFYIGTALLFFLLAGVLALLMRLQLGWPNQEFAFLKTILPTAALTSISTSLRACSGTRGHSKA